MTYEFPGSLWDRLDPDQRDEEIAELIKANLISSSTDLTISAGKAPRPLPPKLAAAFAARRELIMGGGPGGHLDHCLNRCENGLEAAYNRCAEKCEDIDCEEACDEKMVSRYERCADRCEEEN